MPDPVHLPDPDLRERPWPDRGGGRRVDRDEDRPRSSLPSSPRTPPPSATRPPAPPIARECRLIEVFLGDRLRPAGALSLRVLPGHTAEIHFRESGRDEDGAEFPTERIAFRPSDARELLRDLAKVVAELDEAEPPTAARDRAPRG